MQSLELTSGSLSNLSLFPNSPRNSPRNSRNASPVRSPVYSVSELNEQYTALKNMLKKGDKYTITHGNTPEERTQQNNDYGIKNESHRLETQVRNLVDETDKKINLNFILKDENIKVDFVCQDTKVELRFVHKNHITGQEKYHTINLNDAGNLYYLDLGGTSDKDNLAKLSVNIITPYIPLNPLKFLKFKQCDIKNSDAEPNYSIFSPEKMQTLLGYIETGYKKNIKISDADKNIMKTAYNQIAESIIHQPNDLFGELYKKIVPIK